VDQTPLFELPPIFNWSMTQGSNDHAYIQHFHGGAVEEPDPENRAVIFIERCSMIWEDSRKVA
jgi:hypothetical protein